MGLVLVAIIIGSCCLPLLVVLFFKWRFSYWTKKRIMQLNPELFYGDLREMLTSKISLGGAFKNIYFAFKDQNLRYGGVYWSFERVFVPVDLQLIKDMTLKSFSHFQDRGCHTNEKDILTNHLFRMSGNSWKALRIKLTPTFTSSKMKVMFETLCEKTVNLEAVVEECIKDGGEINVTDISARFTTDVISSCAFGIECDSLKDPDCELRVYGKKINIPNPLKQWIEHTFPRSLLYYTGYKSHPELVDFFRNLVAKAIENREKAKVFRKDFMHLLLQLRNSGDGTITKDGKSVSLTDNGVVAQCYVFFTAGFYTSSATITFALYELAQHQDIQNKVRDEMRKVFKKYGEKLTYEGAKELVYTEKVILETLRKYPLLPSIPRICTKAYQIPGTDIVIEKGTSVQIPAWGIHMDPEYYPNPEIFDPDRFSGKEKADRPDFSYLAFGQGPRVCIGARFGLMQVKVGLCGLVREYKYILSPDSPTGLSFKPSMILLRASKDIYLRINKVGDEYGA